MKPCPKCGWCPPRKVWPPEHYIRNVTPIEIEIDGKWKPFASVAEASRQLGLTKHAIYKALQRTPPVTIKARLATRKVSK